MFCRELHKMAEKQVKRVPKFGNFSELFGHPNIDHKQRIKVIKLSNLQINNPCLCVFDVTLLENFQKRYIFFTIFSKKNLKFTYMAS